MSYDPVFLDAHYVDRDGVRLAYGDVGPRDGPVVFLVHGLAASGMQFTEDAHFFADKGYRVIVPDLRGHGRSGCPADMSVASFSIEHMALDMLAIADHIGASRFHYVGNSLGGILALFLLKAHGDRFISLATFGTSYSLKTPKAGVGLLRWTYKVLGTELIGKIGAVGTTKNKAARPLVREMLRAIDIDVIVNIVAHVGNYDLIAPARAHQGPILMLRGELDKSVNAALGPTLKAMEPQVNFTLIDVPGGGHCANLDATTAVRQHLLAFWQAADSRS